MTVTVTSGAVKDRAVWTHRSAALRTLYADIAGAKKAGRTNTKSRIKLSWRREVATTARGLRGEGEME
jgi:hypothetical protein